MLSQNTGPQAIQSPIARPKAPTLLQELRHFESERVLSDTAAITAHAKSVLWIAGILAAGLSTATAIQANPKQWLPIAYVGGSVASSLAVGAAIELNRGKAHYRISNALETIRPVIGVAQEWRAEQTVQLQGFERLVSRYLFDEWLAGQNNPAIDVETAQAHAIAPGYDPAQDLGQFPQSALIAGVPGAGKGVFTLAALAALKQHHPDIQAFYIDPKASDKEAGILSAPATIWRAAISTMTPDDAATWVMGRVEEFKLVQGPKLLIVDELASVMASMRLASRSLQAAPSFRAFLSHITSMGDGERHYLWMVSQDASTEGLGISSALRATLRAIGIISPKNRRALSAFLDSKWLPLPDDGRAGLDALMQASPVGRAVFDGKVGRWQPAPVLANLTGWNRDAQQSLLPAQPIQKPQEPAPGFWDDETPMQGLEGPSVAVLDDPEPAPVDSQALNYLEVWEEWLSNRSDGRCTVRKAQQSAPIAVRTNSAGVKAVFEQLERMELGLYDREAQEFQWVG